MVTWWQSECQTATIKFNRNGEIFLKTSVFLFWLEARLHQRDYMHLIGSGKIIVSIDSWIILFLESWIWICLESLM